MITNVNDQQTDDRSPVSDELPTSMAAAVRYRYGGTDSVELERVAVPAPGRRQVFP